LQPQATNFAPGVELECIAACASWTRSPKRSAISGEFAKTGNSFYVSSLDSISVFDTSDPLHPKLTGTLPNLVFENEAMSYGERRVGDKLRRFVLVGNELYNATVDTSTGPQRGRTGGGEVILVDVTDEISPRVRSLQIATAKSPASAPNASSPAGSGHYWDFDSAGIGWHTGSGGSAAFDVSDPLAPKVVNGTNAQDTATPWNDFIHHNSMRPNATKFQPGRSASVGNGNVLLVTEEDYLNDGDELACERAGTFQTWEIPEMDGAAYRAGNPDLAPNKGSIEPLDLINPVALGDGLSTPVGGFCSAHWFDYHQSGIIAQGYYQQGLRLIDVRNASDLRPVRLRDRRRHRGVGRLLGPAARQARNGPGKKTNVVYTTDLVRGVDVYEVDVPGTDLGGDDGGLLPQRP
jgi:hypothetical protein